MPSPSNRLWRQFSNPRRRMLNRLYAKYAGICQHCGIETVRAKDGSPPLDAATIDHTTPRCELPMSEWFNDEHAVLACLSCNRKGEQEMTRRKRGVSA